jgi:hypothetical protein
MEQPTTPIFHYFSIPSHNSLYIKFIARASLYRMKENMIRIFFLLIKENLTDVKINRSVAIGIAWQKCQLPGACLQKLSNIIIVSIHVPVTYPGLNDWTNSFILIPKLNLKLIKVPGTFIQIPFSPLWLHT